MAIANSFPRFRRRQCQIQLGGEASTTPKKRSSTVASSGDADDSRFVIASGVEVGGAVTPSKVQNPHSPATSTRSSQRLERVLE